MELVTAAQMREIDRLTIEGGLVSGQELMERAGLGVFALIRGRFGGQLEGRHIVVLCGKGNNGGDGFVIARHLIQHGARVSIYVLAGDLNLSADAKSALHKLIPLHPDLHKFADPDAWKAFERELNTADLLVDALFGTGIQSPLREPALKLVKILNRAAPRVLSVDVPSGLSGDLAAEAVPCVHAEITASIGLPKLGLYHYPGRLAAGEVVVVDIGIPQSVVASLDIGRRLVSRESVAPLLPRHDPAGHKYRRGSVLLLGGSRQYGGAPLLMAGGALRGGAGMVYVALPASLVGTLQARWPSAIALGLPEDGQGNLAPEALSLLREWSGKVEAVALGPGLGRSEGVLSLVRDWLAGLRLPAVLDADALIAYRDSYDTLAAQPGPRVLTPHSGELAQLLGMSASAVDADRETVLAAAAREKLVLLHKGAPTELVGPDGIIHTVAGGHPAMARGGTGDVLTGLIGALLAQSPEESAAMSRLGAWLHAEAGRRAGLAKGRGLCSEDIIKAIPEAWRVIEPVAGEGPGPAPWL